jgi:predicted metal-dependent phosphoesterase TrpH
LRASDPIDLQLHTTYSDGHWQPEKLFAHLAGAGFRAVAITDHDRLDTQGELRALGEARDILVIPAVEMTTSWRGMSAHLLCYAEAFWGDALAVLAERTKREQLANTRQVYDALRQRGYEFPRQDEVLADQDGQLRRPVDNARLLREHGYAADRARALALIAEAGYRSIAAPLAEVVAAAHADGALAVLAHPGRGGGEIQRYDPPLLAELLAEIPLDGIEVRYPTYTPEQVEAYAAFAAEHGLLASAGSDSHGPRQRLPVPYPADVCANLLARLGIEVES